MYTCTTLLATFKDTALFFVCKRTMSEMKSCIIVSLRGNLWVFLAFWNHRTRTLCFGLDLSTYVYIKVMGTTRGLKALQSYMNDSYHKSVYVKGTMGGGGYLIRQELIMCGGVYFEMEKGRLQSKICFLNVLQVTLDVPLRIVHIHAVKITKMGL